jgi:hypothetical protein
VPSPRIEILSFDGCPNVRAAEELVGRVTEELGIKADVERVFVESPEVAERAHFLGSPSIRVNGHDIEPGAEGRTDFSYSCRVYRTSSGVAALPEEGWLRSLLASTIPRAAVADTLTAAGISSRRCGPQRTSGLSDAERALYHWILHRFAEQGRPAALELRAKASELDLAPEKALEALAREDLVHTDGEGDIAVAYPFSGRPTRHRVLLENGREVDAMCALDAVGIAAMLGQRVEVHSSDPITQEEIAVSVDPDGEATWQPLEAVVVAGSRSDGPSHEGCCAVLNLFSSTATADRYLAEHPDVRGRTISVPDAVAAGAAIFGAALET